jgi:hypothetical protein
LGDVQEGVHGRARGKAFHTIGQGLRAGKSKFRQMAYWTLRILRAEVAMALAERTTAMLAS